MQGMLKDLVLDMPSRCQKNLIWEVKFRDETAYQKFWETYKEGRTILHNLILWLLRTPKMDYKKLKALVREKEPVSPAGRFTGDKA